MRKNKNKKAQTIQVIIMLVVGLVVVGIMIYLGYKYILGTGKSVGELGGCKGQGGLGCMTKAECQAEGKGYEPLYRMGCPTDEQKGEYCCMPKARTS